MDPLDEILNYVEITPELGTAGQPGREQFALVSAAGYEVVINLAMPDSNNAFPDEVDVVRELGLDYIGLPVVWEAPTLANLEAFFVILGHLQGRKVFVHCARNMRATAFVYLYRLLRGGADEDEAREPMDSIWDVRDYPAWDELIRMAKGRSW